MPISEALGHKWDSLAVTTQAASFKTPYHHQQLQGGASGGSQPGQLEGGPAPSVFPLSPGAEREAWDTPQSQHGNCRRH